MPKIKYMLLKLECFHYAATPDLNTEYYYIRLNKNASNLCMIIIPWGKYFYKHLPMGFANSIDILQNKMND